MRISDWSSDVCSSDLVAGDSQIGEVLQQGIGTGTQLVTLGYSRSQETQADDLAVQYLSRAGYDPAAMASALRSLAAQNSLDQQIAGAGARSVPEWVSTHPDPQSRVQRAASHAASTNVTNGKRNRDAFLTALDSIMYRSVERLVGKECVGTCRSRW